MRIFPNMFLVIHHAPLCKLPILGLCLFVLHAAAVAALTKTAMGAAFINIRLPQMLAQAINETLNPDGGGSSGMDLIKGYLLQVTTTWKLVGIKLSVCVISCRVKIGGMSIAHTPWD